MKNEIVKDDLIQNWIITLRNSQVMIDRDLAELYCVKTKVLNQAVKRNSERFPANFMFKLSDDEKKELVTNCDRFDRLKYSSVNPYAFTEQGVAMLSAVLKSDIAVDVSIRIINAFVRIRKFITINNNLFQRLDNLEKKQFEIDDKFESVFRALEKDNSQKDKGIFFNGEIFDAWHFVSGLIRSSRKSIVLVDNYVDDRVLSLLSKKKQGVTIKIYTKNITKELLNDARKFNAQYRDLTVISFALSHDRFLIIDNKDLYHFGASLKDLGNKWFAFSKMDSEICNILLKLKNVE